MQVPEIRVSIENGVDEYARACLNSIESARPEQGLTIIRAYMVHAVGAACEKMREGAEKGVDRAAVLMLDPEYYERRQKQRANRSRKNSVSDQEPEKKVVPLRKV
jgi:hypothetical protein